MAEYVRINGVLVGAAKLQGALKETSFIPKLSSNLQVVSSAGVEAIAEMTEAHAITQPAQGFP